MASSLSFGMTKTMPRGDLVLGEKLHKSPLAGITFLDLLSFLNNTQMELPHWTDIVKTARFKELAPYDPDWYYIRAVGEESHPVANEILTKLLAGLWLPLDQWINELCYKSEFP